MRPQQSLSRLLETVLTQPTAPFRETWVKRAVLSWCAEQRIPVYEDRVGNLWVGARNPREARGAALLFVAHMDHPGMAITRFEQRRGKVLAHADWLGGGPRDIRGFEVNVFSDVNALVVLGGIVRRHTRGPRGPRSITLELAPTPLALAAATARGLSELGPWGACLSYRRQGVPRGIKRAGGLWWTKAADDLVGACAILEGLRRARAKASPGAVALLTRAEESGYHGAVEVLKERALDPARTLVISVETSARLPGAELGGGPVIRLGDRTTIFSPALVHWLQRHAEGLASRSRSFRFQRRVMDGGTCEATAFNCYGFQVAGLSTPLRNYHNILYSRASRGRPVPEAVAVADVERLAALIAHLMKSRESLAAASLSRSAFAGLRGRILANQDAHMRYFWK